MKLNNEEVEQISDWYLYDEMYLAYTGSSELPVLHAYIWATGVTNQYDAEDRELSWYTEGETYLL